MARLKTISSNLNALLDTIAYAEGTSRSRLTKDDGYDVIVTGIDGPEVMNNYVQHPFANGRGAKLINSAGLKSTASGRYQFLVRNWLHYRDLLRLPDFSPESQDKWAIQLIRERKALPLIENGEFEACIEAIHNLWASLPGAGYDQPEHPIGDLLVVYLNKGGKLWASKPSLVEQLPHSLPSSQPSLQDDQKANQKPTQTTESGNLKSILSGLLNLIKRLLTRK